MAAKLPDVDALLDRHRERFRRLLQVIVAEEEGDDPFTFPLTRFRALSDDERATLVRRAATIAQDRVDRELAQRGATWLVLVGDHIVASSNETGAVPSPEEVLAFGEPRDLVAYLFEAPLIEEVPPVSAWSPIGGHDQYPTLSLSVSGANGPRTIVADLDTGSHATLLDAELTGISAATWFSGKHLGQPFLWAPIRADIAVATADAVLTRSVAVRQVRAWASSPFLRINPKRVALVGRDLMRAFGLEVVLRTREGESEIVGAEGVSEGS
jgi:hypothetical protein